jgi:hypothetical protein
MTSIKTRRPYLIEYSRSGIFRTATVYTDTGHRLGEVVAFTLAGLRERTQRVLATMETKV